MSKRLQILGFFFLFLVFLMACRSDTTPRPRAYFRISLPEPTYQLFDTTYPYQFELSHYSTFLADNSKEAESYWGDIDYPAFNARVHLTYKSIHGNVNQYIEDSYNMVMKHISRSSGIREIQYADEDKRVFGTLYDIRGTTTASPIQFYVTDSTKHFLRGSLYFNLPPNNDSLAPVIAFIEQDIRHLLETLRWK